MISRALIAAVLPMLVLQDPAPAGPVTAYKAGRIITMDGSEVTGGALLVEGGKVLKVVPAGEIPSSARVVDLGTSVILPGLVDAGFVPVVQPPPPEESREISPALRVLDGLTAESPDFQRAVQTGVTTVFVAPGNQSVIGGLAVVLKTAGGPLSARVVAGEAALKACVGATPYWGNYPPRGSAPTMHARRPTTRMGITWLFRKAFLDAREYGKERPAQKNDDAEILLRAMQKRLPVRIAASRAMDLEAAAELATEFGLAVVFEEAEESWKRVDLLKKLKAPVALRPVFRPNAVGSREGSEVRYGTFAALAEAGIPTALLSDGIEEGGALLRVAAFAVRFGAPKEAALRAITRTAAEILGVDSRVGSLAPGKDADFVVLNGDPLNATTRIDQVFIEGRQAAGSRKEH